MCLVMIQSTVPPPQVQQSQSLSVTVKLGFPSLRSTVPRQPLQLSSQQSQSLLVMVKLGLLELGRHGPEQRAHPVLGLQQPQGLLAKIGFLGSQSTAPRQNPSSDEARPPGIEKQGATTDSEIAVSSDEVGPSWSKANCMNSAAPTAAVKSAGEARPHGIAKQSATTKPELAKTSGEAGSPWSRADAKSVAKLGLMRLQSLACTSERGRGSTRACGRRVMLPRPLCS